MTGHVFIVHGDITQLHADAVGYSASTMLTPDGHLYSAFARHFPAFDQLFGSLPGSCRLGDAFWLALPGDGRPRGVVVAASAGGDRKLPPDVKTGLAVRGGLRTAVAELRRERPEGRLLVALPTFRMGLGGDRNRRLASARSQIEAARHALEDLPDVDVAFVAYTADLHGVFLQARHEVGLAPECPISGPGLDDLAAAFRERRGVVFVGAGLSVGAGLPGWGKLIGRLADCLGLSPEGPDDLDHYLDLAQWFVERFGHDELARLIAELYSGDATRPTLAHYLVAALPMRLAVTTNYDDLLERALAALRRYPVPVIEDRDVVRTGQGDGVCVVKLHGDARHGRDIVLTRDDYESYFRRRPAMALLLEGLLLNQTFLFTGYGLKDPNFRQIHSRIADMLRGAKREAFAVTLEADARTGPLLAAQWRRKGLHLLPVRGETHDERVHGSLVFLDWLSDRVLRQTANLFLAPDVTTGESLEPVRRTLGEQVGGELEAACRGPLDEGQARNLAEVLAFLAAHGWRPNPRTGRMLWQMWARLAEAVTAPAERRRLLVAALRHAERYADVARISEELARLEEPPPGIVSSGPGATRQ